MTLPAQVSPRVAALLKKSQAARGRLIFALDATASRELTWDMAATLQAAMFEEAARIGGRAAARGDPPSAVVAVASHAIPFAFRRCT